MSDIEKIVEERGKIHGDFRDYAQMAQELKYLMSRGGKNWPKLSSMQKEGLEMIQHKVARILSGDPDHPDHWDDIGGYALIVRQRLAKSEEMA